MNIILFLGPPGSGKSTQASLISDSLHIPLVSMGKLVRLSLDSRFREFKQSVKEGNLLPDHIVFKILTDTIERFDANNGFVLEGYPRTVNQAIQLEELLEKKGLRIDMVFLLEIQTSQLILDRLKNRIQCSHCGKSFDIALIESRSYCPLCHRPLKSRDDDAPDSVHHRMDLYKKEIDPLIQYYANKTNIHRIQADQSIDHVKDQILQRIYSQQQLGMQS